MDNKVPASIPNSVRGTTSDRMDVYVTLQDDVNLLSLQRAGSRKPHFRMIENRPEPLS